jgi:hypothetical protein
MLPQIVGTVVDLVAALQRSWSGRDFATRIGWPRRRPSLASSAATGGAGGRRSD